MTTGISGLKGIIVYTPNGCASVADMEALARYKRMNHIIIDEDGNNPAWKPGDPVPDSTLVFTSCAGLGNTLEFEEGINALRYWGGHNLAIFRRERKRAMLFSHVRYRAEEVERLLAMHECFQYMRIAFVRLFGWLKPSVRDRLGIR